MVGRDAETGQLNVVRFLFASTTPTFRGVTIQYPCRLSRTHHAPACEWCHRVGRCPDPQARAKPSYAIALLFVILFLIIGTITFTNGEVITSLTPMTSSANETPGVATIVLPGMHKHVIEWVQRMEERNAPVQGLIQAIKEVHFTTIGADSDKIHFGTDWTQVPCKRGEVRLTMPHLPFRAGLALQITKLKEAHKPQVLMKEYEVRVQKFCLFSLLFSCSTSRAFADDDQCWIFVRRVPRALHVVGRAPAQRHSKVGFSSFCCSLCAT